MPENVLRVEIHTRMCVVYDMQNVITKSTVIDEDGDSRWDEVVRVMNLEAADYY